MERRGTMWEWEAKGGQWEEFRREIIKIKKHQWYADKYWFTKSEGTSNRERFQGGFSTSKHHLSCFKIQLANLVYKTGHLLKNKYKQTTKSKELLANCVEELDKKEKTTC